MVSLDLLTLPRATVQAARELIESKTGIPGAHVTLSATHQHTGPAQSEWRAGLTKAALVNELMEKMTLVPGVVPEAPVSGCARRS